MTTDIGTCEDFPEGMMRIVAVDERRIGVIRWGGRLFAVRDGCPHQDAPLCRGAVRSRIRGDRAGQIDLDPGNPVITCPWHGWAFDLGTGLPVSGDRARARAYAVRDQDGRVLVEPRRRSRS